MRPSFLTAAACAAGCVLTLGAPSAQAAFSFDDVQLWAGSGAHRAALVIDFNDGKADESLAWGFRWDGSVAPTGEQMVRAIDAADTRLHFDIRSSSFGNYVDGIGYDLNGDGTLATAPDGADHYAAGFVADSFWGYSVAETNPYAAGASWTEASVGFGTRALVDGAWDGWTWGPYPVLAPGEPVAATVPEPGVAGAVIVLAGLALVRARRRGRRVDGRAS